MGNQGIAVEVKEIDILTHCAHTNQYDRKMPLNLLSSDSIFAVWLVGLLVLLGNSKR